MAKMTLKYIGVSAVVSIPAEPPFRAEFTVARDEPFEVNKELGEELLRLGCETVRDKKGKVVEYRPTPAAPFKKTSKRGSSE